jgi:hypothetical protein
MTSERPEDITLEQPEETVDGLPVLAQARAVERARPAALPAVHAAAVAATGFVAGAATVAVIRHRSNGRVKPTAGRGRMRRKSGIAEQAMSVVASRSFLLDVHLLDRE